MVEISVKSLTDLEPEFLECALVFSKVDMPLPCTASSMHYWDPFFGKTASAHSLKFISTSACALPLG